MATEQTIHCDAVHEENYGLEDISDSDNEYIDSLGVQHKVKLPRKFKESLLLYENGLENCGMLKSCNRKKKTLSDDDFLEEFWAIEDKFSYLCRERDHGFLTNTPLINNVEYRDCIYCSVDNYDCSLAYIVKHCGRSFLAMRCDQAPSSRVELIRVTLKCNSVCRYNVQVGDIVLIDDQDRIIKKVNIRNIGINDSDYFDIRNSRVASSKKLLATVEDLNSSIENSCMSIKPVSNCGKTTLDGTHSVITCISAHDLRTKNKKLFARKVRIGLQIIKEEIESNYAQISLDLSRLAASSLDKADFLAYRKQFTDDNTLTACPKLDMLDDEFLLEGLGAALLCDYISILQRGTPQFQHRSKKRNDCINVALNELPLDVLKLVLEYLGCIFPLSLFCRRLMFDKSIYGILHSNNIQGKKGEKSGKRYNPYTETIAKLKERTSLQVFAHDIVDRWVIRESKKLIQQEAASLPSDDMNDDEADL